ncbi:acid protease [Dacryopinax primogenitus]|uniref:Acid protease n=1 Tax=Dacryopinax primogenitus (strain DJM 731) TaxID=1858805 RepID=M5G4V1_DACPD|nr:acid protease [Dacryopinax primogenitus]EJU05291.1 acid protease [Dacryopinax primogenitus]
MVSSLLTAVACTLAFLGDTQAVLLPVTAQFKRGPKPERRRSTQTGILTLGDQHDISYVSDLTIGGETFVVSLDTGSSDLNIEGNVPGANDQNVQIPVRFAVGELDGVMSFVDVEFGGYLVKDQIFNHVPTQQSSADDGLLGLGPSYASINWNTAQPYIKAGQLPHNAGDSLLDRIFQASSNTANCIAIYMSRNEDPSSSNVGQGVFTISEVLTQYKQVMNIPVLPVVQSSNMLEQHFSVVLDSAIGNNGQAISLPKSSVPGVPAGKMVTIFDTGYTFPQVPAAIATAIYGGVSGAKQQTLSDGGVWWTLPCTTEVNAAFVFAGKTYPIHPLDLNFQGNIVFSDLPQGTCVGAFQAITNDAAQALDGQADMILGMAFLRNVYSLFNYGDWIDSNMDQQYEPYVQLLSITDPTTAANEFHQVRSGSSASGGLAQASLDLSTTPASSQTVNSTLDWIKSHLYIVIPAAVGAVILVVLLIIGCCICCRRRNAKSKYQNLSAPAPGHGPSPNPGHSAYASPYSEKRFDMGYTYAAKTPAPAYDDPYSNRGLLEKGDA